MGMKAVGWDINPLAVYITNAKLKALSTSVTKLQKSYALLAEKFESHKTKISFSIPNNDKRTDYLRSWFDESHFSDIERLRLLTQEITKDHKEIFLALASDLLRDYSLQEPTDF